MNHYEDEHPDVTAALYPKSGAGETVLAGNEPVLVFSASNNEEADVVRATLASSGIPALLRTASVTTVMGAVDAVTRDTNDLGIYVAPSNAEAARALLNSPSPTEAELTAEVDADPTTLAQAEARVKHA